MANELVNLSIQRRLAISTIALRSRYNNYEELVLQQSGVDVFETVRIGTRGSKLSLWQANHVADLIRACHGDRPIEIKTYRTLGDKNLAAPLPSIGGKGIFTEALENALRRTEVDFAVHSLKDLPVENAEGLAIGAITRREDHRDVLLSRGGCTISQLPTGARVGTGSLRRRAQLLALRPDLQMVDIRGNVPTRIEKLLMDDGSYDAIVLAAAGLNRLGLTAHISEILETTQMVSAAGQGALAIQCRSDEATLTFVKPLADFETAHATEAERAFLSTLGGGCSLPVGAYAAVKDNALRLWGRVTSTDGRRQIDVTGATPTLSVDAGYDLARELGARIAQDALKQGARQILSATSPGAVSADGK